MSDNSTIQLIDMYVERAPRPLFLSGMFQSPPRNFHTSQDIEFDVQRDDESVAIVIHDLNAGARKNEASLYTNKRLRPPIFDEEGHVSAYDMIKRQPGQNPFVSPDYAANATRTAFDLFDRLVAKIQRAIELMAAQIFQTGALTLIDQSGVAQYSLNFQPKSSHMATVSTTWADNGSTGDPLADLNALAQVIRRDGKVEPNMIIFGDNAWLKFLANAKVKTNLESRRGILAEVAPVSRGQGATFQGWIWLNHYRFEMWTYDGYYKHPQTGALTPYISPDNVIMKGPGRLDLTFGAIPILTPPEQRALPFLPARIASESRGIDLTTNAWVTPDGKHVMISAGTRPLTIPTAIDTFARLDVTT